MYSSDWFEETFIPSLYKYYASKHVDDEGENKFVFISPKQFSIMAQNSTKISENDYVYDWNGFTVLTRKRTSLKTHDPFFTVDFEDSYTKKYEKASESILEKLSYLARTQNPNFKEYAQTYYDLYMSLLHITELDMTDEDEFVSKHANKLNCYFTTILESIGRLF